MKNTIFSMIVLLFGSSTFIVGSVGSPTFYPPTVESRSGNTCADPSLTVTFVQGFNIGQDAYALAPEAGYTAGLTGSPTSGWVYQGEVFLGWDTPDPQNFTTALYRLFDPTTTDYISALAADGNPPSVPGFTVQGILGYVYSTQVCGSVPLLAAFDASAGSHYYTTKVNDHAQLVATAAWADAGIAAYVLPLSAAW